MYSQSFGRRGSRVSFGANKFGLNKLKVGPKNFTWLIKDYFHMGRVTRTSGYVGMLRDVKIFSWAGRQSDMELYAMRWNYGQFVTHRIESYVTKLYRVRWNLVLWSKMELRNCRQFVGRHPSEMEELERLSRWLDWPTIASPQVQSHTNTDKYTNTQLHTCPQLHHHH